MFHCQGIFPLNIVRSFKLTTLISFKRKLPVLFGFEVVGIASRLKAMGLFYCLPPAPLATALTILFPLGKHPSSSSSFLFFSPLWHASFAGTSPYSVGIDLLKCRCVDLRTVSKLGVQSPKRGSN